MSLENKDPVGDRKFKTRYVTVQVRSEVARFARIMEGHLLSTDYKMHWRDGGSIDWLFTRLLDEVDELRDEIKACGKPQRVIHEAVGVANFAMMIADVLLPQAPDESYYNEKDR